MINDLRREVVALNADHRYEKKRRIDNSWNVWTFTFSRTLFVALNYSLKLNDINRGPHGALFTTVINQSDQY